MRTSAGPCPAFRCVCSAATWRASYAPSNVEQDTGTRPGLLRPPTACRRQTRGEVPAMLTLETSAPALRRGGWRLTSLGWAVGAGRGTSRAGMEPEGVIPATTERRAHALKHYPLS